MYVMPSFPHNSMKFITIDLTQSDILQPFSVIPSALHLGIPIMVHLSLLISFALGLLYNRVLIINVLDLRSASSSSSR